jgi:hypothetical protein
MKLSDLKEGSLLQRKQAGLPLKDLYYVVKNIRKVGRWTVFDLGPLMKGGRSWPIGEAISDLKKEFTLAQFYEDVANEELNLGYMQGRGAA